MQFNQVLLPFVHLIGPYASHDSNGRSYYSSVTLETLKLLVMNDTWPGSTSLQLSITGKRLLTSMYCNSRRNHLNESLKCAERKTTT